MSVAKDRLLQWLRDAHAMEKQAETMLRRTANRIEHYPSLKSKLTEHRDVTARQATRIAECIQRLNGGTSTIKDIGGSIIGLAQGISGLFAGDEVVKAALAGYTFEQMEIASYRILVATAETAGEPEIARVCREILQEEEAMASWLQDNLPSLTEQFLSCQEGGATAKH